MGSLLWPGDVVAACVVLKIPETENDLNIYKQIKDSKKLTKKKRKELSIWIKENSLTYGIGTATRDEIDSINILNAIKGSKSCLISNHGQISIGNNLSDAYELANEVELLCEYYYYCRLQKQPKILNNKEMQSVLKKIKSYKSKNGALR